MSTTTQDIDPPAAPLVVELERLTRADLAFESLLRLLRNSPLALLGVIWGWLRGAGTLGAGLFRQVPVHAPSLPYDADLLARLREERAQGRPLFLVSAGGLPLAEAVNTHLALFDRCLDPAEPLVGSAERLASGRGRTAWGVLTALLAAMRPHQWLKNMLVFVPLLTSHSYNQAGAAVEALLAFVAFSLCASSVYLVNDLLDLTDDRRHPRKRKRPFASGALPARVGIAAVPVLLGAAGGLAWAVSPWFLATVAAYFVLTSAYSLYLKRLAVVDVLLLAGLYTARLIAGSVAINLWPSFWLLAFSMFLFLSLALLKRHTEVLGLRQGAAGMGSGRGYRAEDAEILTSLGGAAGYLSVLVLALYINSPVVAANYQRPEALWLLCPILLYWVSRAWMKSHRGLMPDDPVMFAARDRVSRVLAVVMIAIMLLAA